MLVIYLHALEYTHAKYKTKNNTKSLPYYSTTTIKIVALASTILDVHSLLIQVQ